MAPHFRIDREELWEAARLAGVAPLSLNAIAGVLEVAPSTLSRALNGQSMPGAELLAKIAYTFGRDNSIVILEDGGDIIEEPVPW